MTFFMLNSVFVADLTFGKGKTDNLSNFSDPNNYWFFYDNTKGLKRKFLFSGSI